MFFRISLRDLLCGVCLCCGPFVCLADIIYDNGAPNEYDGSEMTHWIQADDFTLSSVTRLEGVQFWQFERPEGFAGSFSWQIYSNSANNGPGTLLYSGTSTNLSHVPTGFVPFGAYAEYAVIFDISPAIILSPGTYWFALHNGPFSNTEGANLVYWEATANPGMRASHEDIAPFMSAWVDKGSQPPADLAFQLRGAVAPRVTAVTHSPSNSVKVSFMTMAGRNYRMEYKNDLLAPSWTTLPGAENITGTGNVVEISDPTTTPGQPHRLYHVTLL